MRLSFIVPYRNRNPEATKNCLQSLENQNFDSFEVILIDYGSDLEVSTEIQLFCKMLSKVRYVFVNTRGWLWCKPHALNLGFREAQGDFLVMVDADMIHLPDFASQIYLHLHADKIIHYKCHYLPQNHQVDLSDLSYNDIKHFELSTAHATGLFAVSREKMIAIQGSNEFYMIWGMEDTDASQRLQNAGLNVEWIENESTIVAHQWHPVAYQNHLIPDNWRDVVYHHSLNYTGKIVHTHYDVSQNLSVQNRPALKIVEAKTWNALTTFTFQNPLQSGLLNFEYLFDNQLAKQGICIQYSKLDFNHNDTFVDKMVTFWNGLFRKFGTTYTLTNHHRNSTYLFIRDYLYYFILYKRHEIQDYHYEVSDESFRMILFSH